MRLPILGLLCCALLRPAGALEQLTVDLSGTWQVVKVADLAAPPPAAGWNEVAVPGVLSGYDYERAWYRRSFEVPAAWQGRRLSLRFGGVKFNSRVMVNDQPAGGCYNGYDAFEVDITKLVEFGQTNQLRVGVHDWTGVFDPAAEPVEWSAKRQIRQQAIDRVLSPIGGRTSDYGIWAKPWLVVSAPVRAQSAAIVTSVRKRTLTVNVTVDNPGPATTASVSGAAVELAGGTALRLPAQTVSLPAQGQAEVTLSAPWAAPHLWSHEDPYLYQLKLTVKPDSGDADEQTIRFGFREFWCEGPDFYLNGHKVHLLASSWWPPNPPSTDGQIREVYRSLKRANTFAFRTHTQPWPENWYTVADEEGVLMIPEGAVWNDDMDYRLDDPRFWGHYRDHLQAMAKHLRNHPSIVMWSLENEFYGQHINDRTPSREASLAALADDVRAVDPTRPVFYESDLDPGFNADVIGMHYPNEWPTEYQWPNCADFLAQPLQKTGGGGGFWDDQPFNWERRKPLYIGEFLWIPSNNPDWSTVFLGDEAYIDYRAARTQAKAISWAMQIRAYRRAEVSGISPWTMVEHGALDETNPCWLVHQEAYRPRAAFTREYDSRFYRRDGLVRTLDVYNDTLEPARMTLQVGLFDQADQPVGAAVSRTLPVMPPGEHRVETVDLGAATGATVLRVTLTSGGQEIFREDHPARVEPRPGALPDIAVGLYDPRGTCQPLLDASLVATRVTSLEGKLPPLLLIGPNAFGEESADAPGVPVLGAESGGVGQRLVQYVAGGGRLLVLPQQTLPPGLFGLQLADRRSTMAFLGVPHPVTVGLVPDDLKFWRGDHFVTRGELVRPTVGGAVPLVVTGSRDGLNYAPLLEVRRGSGTALFCTLRVVEKLAGEPVAAKLVGQMLSYLQGYRGELGRTSLWCADPAAAEQFRSLELNAEPLTGGTPLSSGAEVAVLHDPPSLQPWVTELKQFVSGGGKLLLSDLKPEAAAELAGLGLDQVTLSPSGAPVTRHDQAGDALTQALFREDLYWLGKSESVIGWAARPRLVPQSLGVLGPETKPGQGVTYPCPQMKVTGHIVRVEADHVLMATNGEAAAAVDVPADGVYALTVTGYGSPANGVFPVIAVFVDGRRIGEVYLGSREPVRQGLTVELKQGERAVELRFVNDGSGPGEDRNAYLQSLEVASLGRGLGVDALTLPPAIGAVKSGQGLVVIDELRWTEAEGNQTKALRHLASLLTALGAEFRTPQAVVIEGEAMTIQPGLPYGGPTGAQMAMVMACWSELEVEVKTADRYRFGVVCRGTPADEVWPHLTVTLDGSVVGELTADSPDWRTQPVTLDLPVGRHTVRFSFDNDHNNPPEDRNFFLDKVVIERAD